MEIVTPKELLKSGTEVVQLVMAIRLIRYGIFSSAIGHYQRLIPTAGPSAH